MTLQLALKLCEEARFIRPYENCARAIWVVCLFSLSLQQFYVVVYWSCSLTFGHWHKTEHRIDYWKIELKNDETRNDEFRCGDFFMR